MKNCAFASQTAMNKYGWNVIEYLISARGSLIYGGTETQNDVKKVAAVTDCNIFYIQK